MHTHIVTDFNFFIILRAAHPAHVSILDLFECFLYPKHVENYKQNYILSFIAIYESSKACLK